MPSWKRPAPESLWRAIEIYLSHAYANRPSRTIQTRVDTLRATSAEQLYSSRLFERSEEAGEIIRYSLRLGNHLYPHMKLAIDRNQIESQYFFRVDTHDQHVRPPAGAPEEQAFANLMIENQRCAQLIEAAWESVGLPTFKTFMRHDLARRAAKASFHSSNIQRNVSDNMGDITIEPIDSALTAVISPPGSKSLTNRALILAALAAGPCELTNVLFADDTIVMLDCLEQLGFAPQIDRSARSVRILGRGGKIPARSAKLFCGNSGTTIRFVTALCALGHGSYSLDGIPRMRQRPIGELVELLRGLGARIRYDGNERFPPITLASDTLPGGLARFHTAQSSQYLSAVLQVAPYARHEVRIDLVGHQTSWPYVAMTMRLMDEFGHTPELLRDPDTGEPRQIIIPRGEYRPTKYAVEPDASNATYFMGIAAVHPGSRITIPELGKNSLQGDVRFADILGKMGAGCRIETDSISVVGPARLHAIDADLSTMPDTAQTLAVVSLFAQGTTRLRGLHTLRVKETDRIAALAAELTRLGAHVEVIGDDLIISPPSQISPAAIDTYDDHRMAMSFAIAGTRAAGITIKDAGCVNKTYPDFFADLRRITSRDPA
jgi:3-phosphoshikimate 1-carboxyvinyltransferase